jgi:hypothetical protein
LQLSDKSVEDMARSYTRRIRPANSKTEKWALVDFLAQVLESTDKLGS